MEIDSLTKFQNKVKVQRALYSYGLQSCQSTSTSICINSLKYTVKMVMAMAISFDNKFIIRVFRTYEVHTYIQCMYVLHTYEEYSVHVLVRCM